MSTSPPATCPPIAVDTGRFSANDASNNAKTESMSSVLPSPPLHTSLQWLKEDDVHAKVATAEAWSPVSTALVHAIEPSKNIDIGKNTRANELPSPLPSPPLETAQEPMSLPPPSPPPLHLQEQQHERREQLSFHDQWRCVNRSTGNRYHQARNQPFQSYPSPSSWERDVESQQFLQPTGSYEQQSSFTHYSNGHHRGQWHFKNKYYNHPPPPHWNTDRLHNFLKYVDDIDSVPEDVRYWHDETLFIIKDRYPKATAHYLVMPRERIEKLHQLCGEHGIEIIQSLKDRGEWLIQKLQAEMPHLSFDMGFHVVPSMLQIHLHVISTDFCAEALHWPAHYNAFTTAFFISPDEMMRYIRERGNFWLTKSELHQYRIAKRGPLRCNQCRYWPQTMDQLKEHLEEHLRCNAMRFINQ